MFEYNATVKRVVDGDTIDAYIDLGFDVWINKRIRLRDIDAPECRTRDLTEKRYGLGAKRRLIELLEETDNKFILTSYGVGKYGRVLGELWSPDQLVVSVNDVLISEGHAVGYFGGSKKDIKDALIEAREESKEYVEKHIEKLD